jgi:hypothetical protein
MCTYTDASKKNATILYAVIMLIITWKRFDIFQNI